MVVDFVKKLKQRMEQLFPSTEAFGMMKLVLIFFIVFEIQN